jgi:hypothetical protein
MLCRSPNKEKENPMNREAGQTTDANTQGERNTDPGKTGTMPTQAPLSKMTMGGQTLRDHDFPVPEHIGKNAGPPAMIDTNKPDLEEEHGGGKKGTIKGDTQEAGEAINILDQDLLTPDFDAEK